jgi:hypothetical protein
MAPGRNKILQVTMAANGAQQAIVKFYSMEIDDPRPVIQPSSVRSLISLISDFLHHKLHVDTQSPKVWCRTNNNRNIRVMLIIEEK